MVTCLLINPGYTGHAALHAIPNLDLCVYFFFYGLNCFHVAILKAQVKDTYNSLLQVLQLTYGSPSGPGRVCHSVCLCETRGWKCWSSSLSLLTSLTAVLSFHCFHLRNTCSIFISDRYAPFNLISFSVFLSFFADTSKIKVLFPTPSEN